MSNPKQIMSSDVVMIIILTVPLKRLKIEVRRYVEINTLWVIICTIIKCVHGNDEFHLLSRCYLPNWKKGLFFFSLMCRLCRIRKINKIECIKNKFLSQKSAS